MQSLEYGWSESRELIAPETDEWVEVQIYEILLRIIARIWARVLIGDPACKNEEWLQISMKYTENVLTTAIILRLFPSYFHPLVVTFLPSARRAQSNVRMAKKILAPIIAERYAAAASGDVDYRKPTDLLQWMMDAADENDGQPDKLAHRQLVLTIASIHTSTMCTAHCLYDMCHRQEYFEPLREEAAQILREDDGWNKSVLNKMRKLDSFLKESQRANPPLLGKSSASSPRLHRFCGSIQLNRHQKHSGFWPNCSKTDHFLGRYSTSCRHTSVHGLGLHCARCRSS